MCFFPFLFFFFPFPIKYWCKGSLRKTQEKHHAVKAQSLFPFAKKCRHKNYSSYMLRMGGVGRVSVLWEDTALTPEG